MKTLLRYHASKIFNVMVAICITLLMTQSASGQDYEEDPEDQFISLLNDGYDFDEARLTIADRFDLAVATEIAIWVCFDYEEACAEGESDVYYAWEAFLEKTNDGVSVVEAVQFMDEFDAYLVNGIALFWCSPEPETGCGDDSFRNGWLAFDYYLENNHDPSEAIKFIAKDAGPVIAELIAASNCGEATCYAEYFNTFADGAGPVVQKMGVEDSAVTKNRLGDKAEIRESTDQTSKFANNPGRPKKGWKEKLKCKIRGGKNC